MLGVVWLIGFEIYLNSYSNDLHGCNILSDLTKTTLTVVQVSALYADLFCLPKSSVQCCLENAG